VYYRHIGVYAYRYDILQKITLLPQSSLELCEKLEQDRWIENGYKIMTCKTDFEGLAVDTPEDLDKILRTMDVD
jgi:3-deoxy-manno-octulosonate cytidylyltransferase (CMP-KDO synthetase)